MTGKLISRRGFGGRLVAAAVALIPQRGFAKPSHTRSIIVHGAKADGVTVNTKAIQATIDALAARGGGTVAVPAGVFVTGAFFLKPQVHLHLEPGAVLRCSNDMSNFPPRRTRIEGHFEASFTPALINADGCDGLRITGGGTLDGSGRPLWDQFWKLRNAAPDPNNFPNVGIPRARLALIENSRDVLIEGVTFKDSQFWNLHLYRCSNVVVRKARFEVPDDYKQAPSTDGIDLDSCRDVTIDGCFFSVTDDCIAAKGTKGPHAMEDRDSPPVERIRVRNCLFRRGHHAFACGSEATIVRDVIVENCTLTGEMVLAQLKLRPDTPQRYERITFRNIKLNASGGAILRIQPWTQYRDLKGEAPPLSIVRDIRFDRISGRYGDFGIVDHNPGQTTVAGILLSNFAVTLRNAKLRNKVPGAVAYDRVVVNGVAVNE